MAKQRPSCCATFDFKRPAADIATDEVVACQRSFTDIWIHAADARFRKTQSGKWTSRDGKEPTLRATAIRFQFEASKCLRVQGRFGYVHAMIENSIKFICIQTSQSRWKRCRKSCI